jgi:hypothetical protein
VFLITNDANAGVLAGEVVLIGTVDATLVAADLANAFV